MGDDGRRTGERKFFQFEQKNSLSIWFTVGENFFGEVRLTNTGSSEDLPYIFSIIDEKWKKKEKSKGH